jgi:hypothetical protein
MYTVPPAISGAVAAAPQCDGPRTPYVQARPSCATLRESIAESVVARVFA